MMIHLAHRRTFRDDTSNKGEAGDMNIITKLRLDLLLEISKNLEINETCLFMKQIF